MKRIVEPEWLDELPATDPAAVNSRRDLQRLNHIMGHAGILRALLKTVPTPRSVVELGAGSGQLMLQLAESLHAEWPVVQMTLVDCKNVVADDTSAKFSALAWQLEIAEADVFDWLNKPGLTADIMVANLFLHHFSDGELTRLLGLAARRTNVFLACEPRRGAMPFAASRLLGFLGCNAVTRHDAPVSVRAGFAGCELSGLWPEGGWRLRERSTRLFTHTFTAVRT